MAVILSFLLACGAAAIGYRLGRPRQEEGPKYALLLRRVGLFSDNYDAVFSSWETEESFRGRITISLWAKGFWENSTTPVVSFAIRTTRKEAKRRLLYELNRAGILLTSEGWKRSVWEYNREADKGYWGQRSLHQLPYGESVFEIEVEESREAEEIAAILEADSALRAKVLHLLRGEK